MQSAERASAPSLAQNSRVGGKYLLNRRIAVGGMGDVWIAKNETTDAQVALKILRPPRDARTQACERFRREAKLGGLLVHRGIVRIFDFLEEPDGTLILVMELLRGDSLEHYIEKHGAVSAREALAIMVPVLSALQHGHDHGVVHRDVKPANIFVAVDPDGHVIPKILDFGIAKTTFTGTKTIDGLVLGTPRYMSPEQINADESIDGRSDLFSVGVVLYELLTGTCPFQAPAASASIAAVLLHEVDPDPRIDPKLWLEIQRALKKRPAERHSSAAEMAAALCNAVGETEDALSSVMRRSKPPMRAVPEPPPTLPAPEEQTQSVAGHSVATPTRRRTRPAIAAWAVAVGIACVLGVVALSAVKGTPATDARGHVAGIGAPTVSAAPPPTASEVWEVPSEPDSEAENPPGSAPSGSVSAKSSSGGGRGSPRPLTPRHTKPSRPKPIATTPGF
jgi:serine/threonine protein kinase